jgi:hypothetical protein
MEKMLGKSGKIIDVFCVNFIELDIIHISLSKKQEQVKHLPLL